MRANQDDQRSPFVVVLRVLATLPALSFAFFVCVWLGRVLFGSEWTYIHELGFTITQRSGPLDFMAYPGVAVGVAAACALPFVLVISLAALVARVRVLRWTLLYFVTGSVLIFLSSLPLNVMTDVFE